MKHPNLNVNVKTGEFVLCRQYSWLYDYNRLNYVNEEAMFMLFQVERKHKWCECIKFTHLTSGIIVIEKIINSSPIHIKDLARKFLFEARYVDFAEIIVQYPELLNDNDRLIYVRR